VARFHDDLVSLLPLLIGVAIGIVSAKSAFTGVSRPSSTSIKINFSAA
jgi:hypothetical protein